MEYYEFLSTPSARRATSGDNTQSLPICDFYPRPPRGGRPSAFPPGRPGCRISIHALREEGDSRSAAVCAAIMRFLSTPSARRATRRGRSPGAFIYISIHALREEGDLSLIPLGVVHSYFYPRPPRGGRRHAGRRNHHLHRDFYPRPPRGGRLNYLCYNKSVKRFLSTPSARRATRSFRPPRRAVKGFLSTPSARRATAAGAPNTSKRRFLSTPSARRATRAPVIVHVCNSISIHALREEGDVAPGGASEKDQISIHALREEGDAGPARLIDLLGISIHALREEGDRCSIR